MEALDPRTLSDSLQSQATAAVTMATHRLRISHRDRVRHLLVVLADVESLAAQGCNESECRVYETALGALCDRMFGGKAATCEQTARRMELEADTQEDHTQGVLAIDGETPSTLELHARALDKQAVASRTLAGIQRRKAAAIRETRVTAQRRVGVGRTA